MRNIFIILIMISFIACKKDSPTEPADNSSIGIVPLKTGNSWTYKIQPENIIITGTISKEKIIDNQKWYSFENSELWVTNKSDGLWIYDGDRFYLGYRYPAKVGDSCNAMYYYNTIVKSISDTIKVPAGTFICYKYQSNRNDIYDKSTEMIEWYAPNVGMIKSYFYNTNGQIISTIELQSYKLK